MLHIDSFGIVNPFPMTNLILDSSRQVENPVGKEEIPHYEQKSCIADMGKPGLVWERVKQNRF